MLLIDLIARKIQVIQNNLSLDSPMWGFAAFSSLTIVQAKLNNT